MKHCKQVSIALLFFTAFTFLGCSSIEKPAETTDITAEIDDLQEELHWCPEEDGRYTAAVKYYNPKTGKTSNYNLEVDAQLNRITAIYFNKGGKLDESHMVSGGELDAERSTTIRTDKGYEYTVTLQNWKANLQNQ